MKNVKIVVIILLLIIVSGGIFINFKKSKVTNYIRVGNIDEFYQHEIVKNYQDIRNLPINYSKEQAKLDNCFTIEDNSLYREFIKKYHNNEQAFIRTVHSTIEGDIYIVDVLYNDGKVHIVKDYRRDKFSSKEDQIIKYEVYEKIGEIHYSDKIYFIVYNGELPSFENKDKNNFQIISVIKST